MRVSQVAHRGKADLQRGQLVAGDVEHAQVVEAAEGVGLHHGQLPAHQLDLLQPDSSCNMEPSMVLMGL